MSCGSSPPERSPKTRCSMRGATTICSPSHARALVRQRRDALRAGMDRYFDRRIPRRRMRPDLAVRRDRPARARRDHRIRCAVQRGRSCAYWRSLPAITPVTRDVFDGATAERRLDIFLCRCHQRSLRRAQPARADGGGSLRDLCRAHADRQTPAPLAAVTRKRRRDDGDRPGDARQSRTDAHAVGRTARIAARCDRPHRDGRRLASAVATPCSTAHRPGADRPTARCGRELRRRHAQRAPKHARGCRPRPILRARLSRLVLTRGGPRDLAAIRDGVLAAADLARALGSLKEPPEEIADAMPGCRKPDGMLAAELSAALAAELPAFKRDGGFVREGYDRTLDETRALRDESRRVIAALAGALCGGHGHSHPQDQAQQCAGLFRRSHRPARRAADVGAAQRHLHPPPDAGRADPLHHHRAGRA